MINESLNNRNDWRNRPGIVLLVTLVLLIVLSMLGYTLSSRLAMRRHRDRYIIDYSKARYGCDSALKYAVATLQEISPRLIARSREPDFSDLFILSNEEYEELLAEWAAQNIGDRSESFTDSNDFNDFNDVNGIDSVPDFNEPNSFAIRGPYGPPWPFVTKPVEFEIGSTTVRVEIEDENAKYPVCWAMLGDKAIQREAQAGFVTFCEWMSVGDEQIDSLKLELKKMGEVKPFKLNFKPVTITGRKVVKTPTRTVRTSAKTRRARRSQVTRVPRVQTTKTTIPASVHTTDFARLFHSSLIDTEVLARPTIVSESRKESALKYMGMWASNKVNVNTAPRQVLEAAFTFGGDEVDIAEEIIQRRRIKPFKDTSELKKSLFRYSNSIEKCKNYITTASTFFTIRITAVSGVAKASAVMAIKKSGRTIERVAVIYD